MRTVRQLLADKPAGVFTVDAGDPVRTAIERMAERHIGALPVMENGRLAGIVSERDYARKVVLLGRNSLETSVRTIMSAPVVHVGLQQTVNDCMQLMTDKRIRHLPVVEDGRPVGIVSARSALDPDLEEFVCEERRRKHFEDEEC